MSLNGVNSNYQAYETNTASGSDKKVSTKEISKTTAYSDVAATYEHTSQSEGLVTAVNKKASNASIVAQLKADLDTLSARYPTDRDRCRYTHVPDAKPRY